MDVDDIPDHVKQTISAGEEIISAFTGDCKFGKKSYGKVLCVLTTEKFMCDAKKKLEKLFLSNIISTEYKKGKISLFCTERTGEELKVIVIPLKNSGEKKDAFQERLDTISKNFDVFSDSATEKNKELKVSSGEDTVIIMPKPIARNPKKFCPECGEKFPPGGTFCPACGFKF